MKWSGSGEPEVRFSDNHLLIAFKPAGWLTQPDGSDTPSLEEFCKEWVKRQYQKPGNVFLHCIHRLDRPVSGLVLFARTSKALSRLNEQSREQRIERTYIAEVEGIVAQNERSLTHFLVHGDHKAIVFSSDHPEAKRAQLRYRVEQRLEHSTLLKIDLETGRYHQIRAQLGAIGHPICGDGKYGAKSASPQIRLCCAELRLAHPVSKEALHFSCSAPF